MDLQQKSWLSEVRIETRVAFSDGAGSGKRLMSPEVLVNPQISKDTQPAKRSPAKRHLLVLLLPLRRAARQLLHFALLRSARVIPRLQRVLGFALLARGAFQFLAFVFA